MSIISLHGFNRSNVTVLSLYLWGFDVCCSALCSTHTVKTSRSVQHKRKWYNSSFLPDSFTCVMAEWVFGEFNYTLNYISSLLWIFMVVFQLLLKKRKLLEEGWKSNTSIALPNYTHNKIWNILERVQTKKKLLFINGNLQVLLK